MTQLPTQPEPQQLTPMEQMRGTLTRMRSEFSAALPPQIPVEKFIRTTLTAVQMNPDLLQTDRKSLFGSCMKAAQDGLLLDGREAALVIFRSKSGPTTTYMPMIGGLLKKLRNSGELASISANVVHERDKFDYTLGDDERIEHKPYLGKDRGPAIAVYAIARTKDGATYREVMSVDDIEQVRNVSRAKDSGPWVAWWGEMARKTIIRRLCKRLPSSADVDQVFEHDNEGTDFTQREQPAALPAEPLSRLKASIALSEEPAEQPLSSDPDEAALQAAERHARKMEDQ